MPQLVDFNHFAWHCSLQKDHFDLLNLVKIEGCIPTLPEQYLPPTYALEFVVKGHTKGKVNDTMVELHPNDAFFILADCIHKEVATSPDCEIYVLGLSSQFAEMLNLHLPQAQLSQLLMRPVWHMRDEQMAIVLRYLEMLRVLIEEQKGAAVLHMVRSLVYNLADDYMLVNPQQTQSLTRGEQICGEFLSLVEIHCREQHSVEWYADRLHLSPKYLSNVVKHTLHTSPNASIDQAILRQAKSLLSSTSLSVQEISDRLGFQNQSHFGTFFRRHGGVSPTAFRKA